jgi:hypothetical protein
MNLVALAFPFRKMNASKISSLALAGSMGVLRDGVR